MDDENARATSVPARMTATCPPGWSPQQDGQPAGGPLVQRHHRLRSLLARVDAPGDARDRLAAVAQLRRELEVSEAELVAGALRLGLTWSQIGGALGISKQAAHRRHSRNCAKLHPDVEDEGPGEKVVVAPAVRQAVRIARREAAQMGATHVGTEHLLLGLLQCGDGSTTRLLERHGATLQRARRVLKPTAPTTALPTEPAPASWAGLSPAARHALEQALRDVYSRPFATLGATNLLRALVSHGGGGLMATLGVDPDRMCLEAGAPDAADAPQAHTVEQTT